MCVDRCSKWIAFGNGLIDRKHHHKTNSRSISWSTMDQPFCTWDLRIKNPLTGCIIFLSQPYKTVQLEYQHIKQNKANSLGTKQGNVQQTNHPSYMNLTYTVYRRWCHKVCTYTYIPRKKTKAVSSSPQEVCTVLCYSPQLPSIHVHSTITLCLLRNGDSRENDREAAAANKHREYFTNKFWK
jgi:hypothetical protein